MFSDNTSHRHDWYPEYEIKIGRPSAAGERLGSHAWKRRYEKALVAMNLPGAREPLKLEFERPAKDSLTGEEGRSFEVPPGDGRILLFPGAG